MCRVTHGMTRGCHMAPWKKDTWHESHVVWRVPPRTCVHVTHGSWKKVTRGKINSRVRGSFLLLEGNKKKNLWVRGERKERRKKIGKK